MTKKYNDSKRESSLQQDELNRITVLKTSIEQELEETTDQCESLKKELARQSRGGGYVLSSFPGSSASTTPTPGTPNSQYNNRFHDNTPGSFLLKEYEKNW